MANRTVATTSANVVVGLFGNGDGRHRPRADLSLVADLHLELRWEVLALTVGEFANHVGSLRCRGDVGERLAAEVRIQQVLYTHL